MTFRERFYKNYYQNQASRYDEAAEPDRIAHAKKIFSKEILPQIPRDKNVSILELACGHGTLLGLLQKTGYTNTTGVDISEDQIKKAKELGIQNVFCAEILDYLSSSSESYDVIIGIDIIEHLTKSELLTLLDAIKEHLNPGGRVIFRTPNCDAPLGSTFYFGDFTHEIYLNYFSAEQVMLTMGFSEIKIRGSYVAVSDPLKNFFRAILWLAIRIWCKLVLFASGRSSKNVLFTPNLIITAKK